MANPAIAPATPAAQYRDAAGMQYLQKSTDQFKRDVLPKLIELDPDQAQLLTLLTFGPLKSAPDVTEHPFKFEHFFQRPRAMHVTVAAQALVGATTVTLASGDVNKLTGGMVLYNNRTKERIRIPSSTGFSGATIQNVERAIGSNPAAQMEIGDTLIILNSVRSESEADPTPLGYSQDSVYNYLNETSLATGATLRMQNTDLYAGWNYSMEQKQIANAFREQMDRALWFSDLDQITDPVTGYNRTHTRGFDAAITTNYQTLSGVPDWPQFCSLIRPYMRYGQGGLHGKKLKHAFVAPAWMNWAQQLPTNHVSLNYPIRVQSASEGYDFGWFVSSLNVNGQRLMLHEVTWWGDYPETANRMAIVDPSHFGIRYGKNRHVQLASQRADNNTFTDLKCWYADFGVQNDLEAAHGLLFAPLA